MKKLFTILFIVASLHSSKTKAQVDSSEAGKQQYIAYTKPISDSAARAFKLWELTVKGAYKSENYNPDSLLAIYRVLKLHSRKKYIAFFKSYPNNYWGLHYFHSRLVPAFDISADSLAILFSYFSNDLRATPLGKETDSTILKKLSLRVGNYMPGFTTRLSNGDLFELYSATNKNYVLICFWDSYCKPCIASIPALKKLYSQYNKSGLEIISISVDRTEEKWKAALDKYQMPWLQTVSLPAYTKMNIEKLYDIQYMPQYFLVDNQGKLIYHNYFSNDDDDYTLLHNLLSKHLN